MSAVEMRTFESQLAGLSYAEQLYVMEYLLKLMRLRQQNESADEKNASAKAILGKIQGMFAEDKGWSSEDEMLEDLAGFRRERESLCAY
ncbi:MAG: hypothetical protein IKH61_03345 [Bacteroidales bacterium]|nr:hypothetical protein [Bacteroidales bacterium]